MSLEHAQSTDVASIQTMQIRYAQSADITQLVDIFVTSFPQRVASLFRSDRGARAFYGALFELMHRKHPQRFFVAGPTNAITGYLILTMPGEGPSPLRMARQMIPLWLRGNFGFRGRMYLRAVRAFFGSAHTKPSRPVLRLPHVYVMAVAPEARGTGTGTRLLRAVQAACQDRFRGVWLNVETNNIQAIRFYERNGFRALVTGQTEQSMVWYYSDGPNGEESAFARK
jgi:ribosomal protein S18 acetylase RimI-like enzyme